MTTSGMAATASYTHATDDAAAAADGAEACTHVARLVAACRVARGS